MSGITLERAKKHLDAWLEAELAVSTGQSYKIGARQLQRADLGQIREQIRFWENKIAQVERSTRKRGPNRVVGVIPRDF